MMKMMKMCNNVDCSYYQRKVYLDSTDEYCSKCGQSLVHVCKGKKCTTILIDKEAKYCLNCEAEKEDKQDNIKGNAKKALGAIAGIALTASGAVVSIASGGKIKLPINRD